MRKLLAGAVIALSLAGCAQVAEPPQPTDAEFDAYIREQQDLLWYEYGSPQFERPAVESEVADFDDPVETGGCEMSSASMVIIADTGVVETKLRVIAETAQYQCLVAALPYPSVIGYYTPAQLGFLYDYFHDVLVPCLQAQGLSVGFTPTREEFTAAAGTVPWDPYTELGADLPPSRADEIRLRCAAMPDADFLEP